MRIFWALIAVLVLCAAGFPLVKSVIERTSAEKARAEATRMRQIAERERRSIESDVKQSLDEADAAATTETTPAPNPQSSTHATLPAVAAPAESPQVAKGGVPDPLESPLQATSSPKPEATPVDAPGKPVAAPAPLAKPSEPVKPAEASKPAEAPSVIANPPPTTQTNPTTSSPVAPAPSAAQPNAASAPAAATPEPDAADLPKIVKKDDGSLLIDDRFVVKGEGTQEKPYEITWELLVSAQESYDPRVGRKKIPARVMMLDGKFVRLNGYVAYPLFVEQPRECLAMLNQWDGCCIGVPPTPYDAVEVRLKKTVDADLKMATYGVVEGKLGVKPYVAGDWLVGLYVMEQGGLAAKQQDRSGQ